MRRTAIVATVLVAGLALFVGCKKVQPVETPAPVNTPPPTPAPPPPDEPTVVTDKFPSEPVTPPVVEPDIAQLNASGVLKTVYFDYDSDQLSDSARSTLQGNADWLKRNPARSIEIGGHCDERGTIEYNLALGSRRANIVKDYLSDLGVSNRVEPVSYGEEKPADMGHGDTAYSKNRRADFRIKS